MSVSSNETEHGPAREGSAEVIPFPARPAADAERLRRALAALDRALSDQRQAVSTWRGALGDLREAMAGLGGRVATYQGELGKLAGGVSGLNARATWLRDWADKALAEAPRA